jgi:hypothetical protein
LKPKEAQIVSFPLFATTHQSSYTKHQKTVVMADKLVNGVILGLSDEIVIEFNFQKKIQNEILSLAEDNFFFLQYR